MVSEKGGDFSLPGGGWDYGETMHDCLVRELDEEIAMKGSLVERVITALPFYNPNKQAWQMWIVCEVVCDQLDIGVGEHADKVQWMHPDDIDYSTTAGQLIGQVIRELES